MLPLEKDRQHKSELQLKMAEVSSRLGRFDEAKHQLQMLLLTDKQNGIAFLQLVELAKKRGNIQEVKQLSKRAGRIKLNELQQLELSQLQAETDTLAGNYPTAIDKLKAVVTRLADRKASTTHCRTYNSLGLVYFYLEKYDEAIRWLHLAQKLAQQLDLPLDKVTALYRLGMVQIRLRRTDDALKVLLQAKELAKAIGDLKQLCNIELNLGTLYQAQNDVSSALNSYQEGLRYATHMDDHTNKIISHFNLATLQHFLGAYTKAKSSLFMPLRLSELYHQNYFLAYSRLLTGVIESEESFGQKAREKLLLATRKIFQLRKPQDLALCYLELARNDLQQKKLRRARFYLLKLQKYLLTNPHQLLQAQSQWLLAQTAFYSPEEATKNFEELCDDLEQDSSLEGRDLLWKIEFTLSQYYLQLRETTHSQSLLRQSRDSYKKLLKLIPKNYQNEFSSSPTRRSLLNEIEAKLSEWTRTGLESSSIDELSRVILNEQESLLPILEISRKLNSLLDLKSLLDFIMNIMMSMTGAKHGYLLITSGSSFETFAERNLSEEESRASHSIAKLVMKSGTPLITHDAMHDERLEGLKTVVDLKLRSILCLPFRLKGEIIGVLYLEHRTRSNAFQNDTVRVLEAIADQAAIAIHNARLHSTSIEQEKKIRQLNRQLQAELEIERQRLKESERLVNSQQQALAVKFRAHNIITRSKKMRQVLELVEKVGDSDATILIQGESGTGKELIARAIHYNGRRKLRPFLTINCSALTETLLESELFGHEKGSFTGANRLKKGLFEMADSGTLFLDEVGDMSMSMQVKLLRVLQENEIRRVGGQATIKIDVRIISATNLDIDLAVKEGRFREDLFYRLNTIRVQIPPLRQRREDIPLLVRHILSQSEKPQIIMAAKTLELLSQHSWPGNVRELQNELERALIFADQEIRPEHLSPTFLRNDPLQPKLLSSSLEEVIQGKTLDQLMGQLEKEVLVTALKIHQGRKGITAQELGVTRFTLYRKLKEHGLGEDD
jgi:Nif-specific regulatory protein